MKYKSFHRIRWVEVTGGFLDGLRLEFTAGLNCIIGGRGAGKTTILELIRFALDAFEEESTAKRVKALVAKNLDFGRVELGVETSGGLRYLIARSHDGETTILTEDRKPTPLTLKAGALFKADIYSQNEVERMADCAASQLHLVDSFDPVRIADWSSKASRLTLEAAGLAKDIVQAREKIALLEEETRELENVNAQLQGMSATSTPDAKALNQAHANRGLRERERRALEQVVERVTRYRDSIQSLMGNLARDIRPKLSTECLEGPNGPLFESLLHPLGDTEAAIDLLLEKADKKIAAFEGLVRRQQQTLDAAHATQELAFQEWIAKQQLVQGETKKRAALERRRNLLLERQQELRHEQVALEQLEARRAEFLRSWAQIRDERFAQRQAVCQRLTDCMAHEIRIGVLQDGNKTQYRAKLDELLKGARFQEASKEKLAELFPGELARLVREGNLNALIDRTGLTEAAAKRVIGLLASSPGLYELETVELIDRPRIELNDNGRWKDSRALSTGQKCTAVLPILLLENEKPLLIDQPEDNLDNRYLSDKVVRTITAVKQHRQLIFVTHNPNIPVLGDAERLFVLDSTGTSGRLLAHGGVDECRAHIVNLLEGGKEAFERRAERYRP